MVVVLALLFDFSNGWNDSANAIATVVSTRVLSPRAAVMLAAVLNIAGAFYSTAVAQTIGGGIVDPKAVTQLAVLSALVGGTAWNTVMTILGLPISASHALMGGVLGAAIAQGGTSLLNFSGVSLIFKAMLISPLLGLAVGALLMFLLLRLMGGFPPTLVNRLFRNLQIVSISFMAFSHGTNDAQKAMGIITMALVSAGVLNTLVVPWWVIVAAALAMGLGTALGGWRVIKTLGMRMLKLEPVHGFAAETAAAAVLITMARLGVPVSTTHTITGSILGVGASRRLSAVRWGIAGKILYAWIFTLPGSGAVAFLIFLVLRGLIGT